MFYCGKGWTLDTHSVVCWSDKYTHCINVPGIYFIRCIVNQSQFNIEKTTSYYQYITSQNTMSPSYTCYVLHSIYMLLCTCMCNTSMWHFASFLPKHTKKRKLWKNLCTPQIECDCIRFSFSLLLPSRQFTLLQLDYNN